MSTAPDNDKAIKKILIGHMQVWGETFTAERLVIYSRVLSQFTAEQVEAAFKLILQDPKQLRFPLPAQILEKIRPTLSCEDAAQELLARCIGAVSRFGYYDADGARQYLGEDVWRALPGDQGWQEFCSSGDEDVGGLPIGVARAQLRDRISSQLRHKNPTGRLLLSPPGDVPQRTFIPFAGSKEDQERDRQLKLLKNLDGGTKNE